MSRASRIAAFCDRLIAEGARPGGAHRVPWPVGVSYAEVDAALAARGYARDTEGFERHAGEPLRHYAYALKAAP